MGLSCLALAACGGSGKKVVHERPAPPQPIASSTSAWLGQPVRLDLMSLERSGPVARVVFRLTNQGSADVAVANLFGTGSSDTTMKGLAMLDLADGVTYPVASTASGGCACTSDLSAVGAEPHRTVTLSATFGAPPPRVRTVNLFVPHFGTFVGVPLKPVRALPPPGGAAGPVALELESDAIDESIVEIDIPHHTDIRLAADVLFAFDKSALTSRADAVIQQVVQRIHSTPRLSGLRIDGYTDSKGSAAYNVALSNRRAAAVAGALRRALGASAPSMTVAGHGAADPVAPNTKPDGTDNPAGRALNRRVEVSYAH